METQKKQCDVCQSKVAEVFLTQIVEGKVQKVDLCKECSKDRGVDDPTGFALTELLAGLGTSVELEKPPAPVEAASAPGKITGQELVVTTPAAAAAKCPACGFTQADFKKTGRLGCGACYETFADSLSNLLKAMHKGTHHTGKLPARVARMQEIASRMKGLQDDLQKAVRAEDYENAASLRDQIRKLSGQVEN